MNTTDSNNGADDNDYDDDLDEVEDESADESITSRAVKKTDKSQYAGLNLKVVSIRNKKFFKLFRYSLFK